MFQLLLILSVVFSIYSVVKATCPVGWTQYDTNCYKFGLVAVTWSVCQSTCASLNAMMLCVTDASTNAWLWTQTGDASPTWIGLSDIGHVGTYTWVSGCSSTYTNWENAQPDSPGAQHYAYFWRGHSGKWDNLWPSYTNVCACQISFDAVSE
jgi:hypothetical protein